MEKGLVHHSLGNEQEPGKLEMTINSPDGRDATTLNLPARLRGLNQYVCVI
jgi:hypothetical protein